MYKHCRSKLHFYQLLFFKQMAKSVKKLSDILKSWADQVEEEEHEERDVVETEVDKDEPDVNGKVRNFEFYFYCFDYFRLTFFFKDRCKRSGRSHKVIYEFSGPK